MMSDRPAVFAEEWRACLSAHYQAVVQQNNEKNERSLIRVLSQLQFGEQELKELRAATTEAGANKADLPALEEMLVNQENDIDEEIEIEEEDNTEEELSGEDEIENAPLEPPQLSLFD